MTAGFRTIKSKSRKTDWEQREDLMIPIHSISISETSRQRFWRIHLKAISRSKSSWTECSTYLCDHDEWEKVFVVLQSSLTDEDNDAFRLEWVSLYTTLGEGWEQKNPVLRNLYRWYPTFPADRFGRVCKFFLLLLLLFCRFLSQASKRKRAFSAHFWNPPSGPGFTFYSADIRSRWWHRVSDPLSPRCSIFAVSSPFLNVAQYVNRCGWGEIY